MERFGDARDWFFEKRFGLFIHWGLYAIHGWHEQEQWRGRLPADEYQKLTEQWNPTAFDPEEWLDLAQEVGMEYLVFTTKHHDGFCLWDTRLTDYNVMQTPYGRDVVGLLAQACHRRDFPLGLYYSIADWHHPNYPNQGRHHELPEPKPGDRPDWDAYMEFLRGQVRELCTNYGPIHAFWWDMNVPEHVDPSVNAMIRELQPTAVINNRGFDEGDFGTPERDLEPEGDLTEAFERATEACQSVGVESWGYRQDEDFYTDRHLQRSMAKYLARGANYLLNVGPTARGLIPSKSRAVLRRLGEWYGRVREALVDVEPCSRLTDNREVLLTRRGNTLYVHLVCDPTCDAVKLKLLAIRPETAIMLNTGQAVQWAVDLLPSEYESQRPCLRLKHLPVNEQASAVLVVKMQFAEPPVA